MALVILAALAKAVLRYVEQFLGHLAAFRLMGEMRVWTIDRLIPQAPAVTDGLGAARIHTIAVRDVDRVEVFFAHTIAPAITAVLIPLVSVITVFMTAGFLPALALTAVYAVGFAVALAGAKKSRLAAKESTATRADLAQFIADSIRLREDLLVYDSVPHRLDRAAEIDSELGAKLAASGATAGVRYGVNTLRVWGGTVLMLAAGIPTLTSNMSALPGILLAASLVAGTANSMNSIERLAGSLPAGLEAVRRIRELGNADPSVTEPKKPQQVPSHSDVSVRLNNVGYRYPGADAPVLDKVCIDIPTGHFVGIAGPTGSGKSTIARLVQRHFDATSGTVSIHGVNVADLGSEYVHRFVAVADQDPFIVEGTIAENLRLGAPTATEDTLLWALGIAELDRNQFSLDKRISRRGDNLSGGQKQRLALARTLVRATASSDSVDLNNANLSNAILVLDEATSHQDPLTQQRIIAQVRGLGATVVLIAHRLTTLQHADQIYVLEAGRVVEQGTFNSLAHSNGLFAAMLAAADSSGPPRH
nr:ABC transporter ATP-binding protein [Corynebacterium ulceribovis]